MMSNLVIKSIGKTLNAASHVSSRFASKKALNLFATPRKGRYTKWQNQLMDGFARHDLEHDGFKIASYYLKNSSAAETILLAHGWESNASRWHYLFKKFKEEGYNIVALDAPAHGESDGKQFNAILYSEFLAVTIKHYNPDVLIGHSVGGMSSVFALHNYNLPSIKKLVLLGAPAHFTGVFSRYKQMMGYNGKISKGLDSIVLERFHKPVDYFSAANFTSAFTMEGLIVHDKKDAIIPYEDALLYNNRFKTAKLISTTGFGHGLKDSSLIPKIIAFINA